MKRKIKILLTVLVLSFITATTVLAGEWVQGVDQIYPNAWSYKNDSGKWMQNDYVSSADNSQVYYISPDGTMVANNYAPNGVWAGADGVLQYGSVRTVYNTYPKGAVYGWNDGAEYIMLSFYYHDDYDDGLTIADVTAHITGEALGNGFYMDYNLIKLENGCFALCSDDNTTYEYYLSISEDGNTLLLTSGGETSTYTFLEDLIYS